MSAAARLAVATVATAALVAGGSLGVGLSASAREAKPAGRARETARAGRAREASYPAHLQVTQVEYRLLLSRGVVKAGDVDLQEIDAGMDQHDLRLRREGSGPTIDGQLLSPGQRWNGVVHLKPGTYRLWCSLPEHERLGMHAVLRVVP